MDIVLSSCWASWVGIVVVGLLTKSLQNLEGAPARHDAFKFYLFFVVLFAIRIYHYHKEQYHSFSNLQTSTSMSLESFVWKVYDLGRSYRSTAIGSALTAPNAFATFAM